MVFKSKKEIISNPGQCASVFRESACTPKGCGFDSRSRDYTWVAGAILGPDQGASGRQPIHVSLALSLASYLFNL